MLYRFGRFQMNATEFRLQCDGQTIPLEPKALHLLLHLVARPRRLVRKQELLDELWPGVAVTENALTRCVTLVRRALGDDSRTPIYIETVPRVGYRFLASTAVEEEPCTASLAPEPNNPATSQTPPASPGVPAPQPVPPATHWALPRPRNLGIALAAVTVAFATILLWLWHRGRQISAVAARLETQEVSGAPRSISREETTNEAQEQYRRGLYYYDRRNAVASAAAFQRAIQLAPNYAPAYAGLALALTSRATLSSGTPGSYVPDAIASAKQAIALDPNNGEAWLALGTAQTQFTWEWKAAEENLTRGLHLSPGNAPGHIWYAVLLQSTGKNDAAIAEARKAVSLAPLSFFMVRMLGSVLYFGRHYDEALRVLEHAREMQPQSPNVVDKWVSWIDEQRGLYDDAVEHDLLSIEEQSSPAQIAQLRSAYRRSGWRAYWRLRLQVPTKGYGGCASYFNGLAYARLGEADHALAELEEAAAQHCFWMGMIQVDPALDPIRHTSEFGRLEQSILAGAGKSPSPSPNGLQVATRR